MQKKQWYLFSIAMIIMSGLLVAGEKSQPNPVKKTPGIPVGICSKSKVSDCSKKEKENPMILESLSRQFIIIAR